MTKQDKVLENGWAYEQREFEIPPNEKWPGGIKFAASEHFWVVDDNATSPYAEKMLYCQQKAAQDVQKQLEYFRQTYNVDASPYICVYPVTTVRRRVGKVLRARSLTHV